MPKTGVSIVIADTNKKRPEGNLTTWYNERVDECAQAVAVFQKYLPHVQKLRDVSVEEFEKIRGRTAGTRPQTRPACRDRKTPVYWKASRR